MSERKIVVDPTPTAPEAFPDWRIMGIDGRPFYKWERERRVTCVVCPGCAFTFDASHKDDDMDGYTCPLCGALGR